MDLFLFTLIFICGFLCYWVGIRQMIQGTYAPSVFSRVVWLMLSMNSFAGVVLSHSSSASIALASILMTGNLAMCVMSFSQGTKSFGKLEIFCLSLLLLSAVVWVFFSAPLVNLSLSLFAHFIGAIPTYKRAIHNPLSESQAFWFWFFAASALSLVAGLDQDIEKIIFPIYFTLFDGSLFVLCLRRYQRSNSNSMVKQM